MLIIDISKQKVHNSPHYDADVVILKGASNELIASLAALSITTPVPAKACCGVHKIGLANRIVERFSKTVPESILAEGNGQFKQVFQKISKALSGMSSAAQRVVDTAIPPAHAKAYQVSSTFQAGKAQRRALQTKLTKLLLSDESYVETLRTSVQFSVALNPNAHVVTTRNLQAAIALYARYGDDRTFSAKEGATAINTTTQVSTDTIARLASELSILTRVGRSTGTRYHVRKQFATTLISVLNNYSKFRTLLSQVDTVQNQIDALGSL